MAQTLLDDRQVVNRAALSALGNTANLTLDVIMGDINTFFANATSNATPSVLMLRDVNANTRANNFIEGFTTTATGATTTTLTVASTYFQQFTGTTTQTVILPNATTLVVGQSFTIANRSTGNVTIQTNGGANLQVLTTNSQATFTVVTIATSAGTWDVSYSISGPIPFLQTQVTTDATTTGSAATTLAADTNFGTVRLTNGSLVSLSGIVAGASGQYITIENQTGNLILINNNDAGATAANRIFTGTGANITMSNNASFTFVYDTTQSIWMLVGGTGSGSGSGSGKNYLSAIVTSQSVNPNTGNGNFELGSTTGWALGTIGTLTNGLPTGSPTFGSGASGNLSISTVSSGQLAGSYSLSYASSSATTQGNMLASDAFYIDTEDQAKVLTWKFYYKAQTNPSNADWSGTSSNSFGVAVYDVTNSTWLGTTASFGMTQSSGVGYATGTFQTATTTTQLQFVVYNVNATSGAITLYFDDFTVGPQTEPIGAPMTDWINAGTVTIGATTTAPTKGTSTTTVDEVWWRRVGDSAEIRMAYGHSAAGTATSGSGDYLFQMPAGLVIDTSKITAYPTLIGEDAQIKASNAVGSAAGSSTTAGVEVLAQVIVHDANNVKAAGNLAIFTGNNAATTSFGSAGSQTPFAGANVYFTLTFTVPIVGWSSNVQMSSDTDTRIVAGSFYYTANSTSITANTAILYPNSSVDTHAAWNSGTGLYTVPVSGVYQILITGHYGAATNFAVFKNGSSIQNIAHCSNAGSSPDQGHGQTVLTLNAGDTISIRPTATVTLAYGTSSDGQPIFSILRLTGPSVIAATESVNARYYASTSTPGTTGTPSTITYSTKDFDSHNAYSSGTYTVPVSGKYQINASTYQQAGTIAANEGAVVAIFKNGSAITENETYFSSASSEPLSTSVSDIISCLAGDLITIRAGNAGTTPSLSASNVFNYFSIARVGN